MYSMLDNDVTLKCIIYWVSWLLCTVPMEVSLGSLNFDQFVWDVTLDVIFFLYFFFLRISLEEESDGKIGS